MSELHSPTGNTALTDEPLHTFLLKRIKEHAKADPSKKAYINVATNKSLTFNEVCDVVHKTATFLYKRGIRKGDCIMTCMQNSIYTTSIFISALDRGAYITGVNPVYTHHEIARQMKDSQCRFVFAGVDLLDNIFKAAALVPGQIQCIVATNPDKKTLPRGVVDFAEVLKMTADPLIPPVTMHAAEDIACLPYSSGTTGVPKGVMLTHKNWTTMLNGYETLFNKAIRYSADPPLDQKNTQIWFLPNFHIYGLFQSVVMSFFGGTTAVLPHFEPTMFLKAIQDYKIRTVAVVPPIVVFLAKSPLVKQYDITSLEWLSSGAAPLGKDTCVELQANFPHIKTVIQGYGMTEMTLACALPVKEPGVFGNSGKTAPNCVNKIIDPTTGELLGANKTGELCTKGPGVMKGYWNRPDATAATIDKDGWLHTGDIAYYDDEGFIFIVDRLKELIKVKGFQVPPAELEDLLLGHPAIADAAVVGIPDMESGELPKAFVVLKPNATITATDVADFIKYKVAHYKQLKGGVKFVNVIPKSPSGKILRRLLKEKAISSAKL